MLKLKTFLPQDLVKTEAIKGTGFLLGWWKYSNTDCVDGCIIVDILKILNCTLLMSE